MDHKIGELRECVFDYLASKPDQLKSFTQIFNDISGPTGHRCSQLQDLSNRKKYKDLFMTICYTVDNEYQNVHKIYKNDKIYLVFSTLPRSEVISKYQSIVYDSTDLDQVELDQLNQFDLDSIIDAMLNETTKQTLDNDFDFSFQLNADGKLLQHLIKKNSLAKLQKILNMFDIELNGNFDGKSLIDIAVESGSADIVKELMQRDYENRLYDKTTQSKDLQKLNTKLQNETKTLTLQNATLKNDLTKYSNTNSFMKIVTLFVGLAMFLSFLH